MHKDIFTTAEVARICNVSGSTVIKWIDSGVLKGFKFPSSKTRRITRKDLLEFMNEYGIPLEKLEGAKTRVLVIDDDLNFCKMLKREFDLDGSFNALIIQYALKVGTMVEVFKPDVVLLDVILNGVDGQNICKFIRQNTRFKNIKVIGISGVYSQEKAMQEEDGMFVGFLKKPFNFSELRKKIREVQGSDPKSFNTTRKASMSWRTGKEV
ncbi:MAG: response regulator [Candidatus Brocadiales bacterium]